MSLGARALTQKLGKEFIEILEKATEEFLEVEGRQTALEEDVKIALVDLHKRIAAEEIHLPSSSRFTTEELLRGLKVIKKHIKNEVDMNQTIKGMILGTAMTVASLLLISGVSQSGLIPVLHYPILRHLRG